jgi:lipoprotein Spr
MPPRKLTVTVPPDFLRVRYEGARHPLARPGSISCEGANCQLFVFELLKHFGYEIAPMRSRELWEDRRFTRQVLHVRQMRPLDILLFNRERLGWGAHLALYLGEGRAIHLSKEVGRPAIWEVSEFSRHERYRTLVGIKRPLRLVAATYW